MTDAGRKSVPGAVVVGERVNIVELGLVLGGSVETDGAGGVCVAVPFPDNPGGVTAGVAAPEVELVTIAPDNGVATVVGKLGGEVAMAVVFVDPGGDGDRGGSGLVVGWATEVVGGEATGEVVVGSLEAITEPRKLLSDAMILERRFPKPVLLVVVEAAPVGSVITTGLVTPVKAAPLTPVMGVGVTVTRPVKDPTRDARGSGISVLDEAAEDTAVVVSAVVEASAGVVVAAVNVGDGVGVGVVESRGTGIRLPRNGTAGSGEVDAVEVVEGAAVAVEPPVPENVTPDVTLSGLATGVVELDVEPDKTPPGKKVIPLPAAGDEDDGVSDVAVVGGSAVVEGSAVVGGSAVVEVETVGRTTTAGRPPVDAAPEVDAAPPVDGSKGLSTDP
jgi:hypothetical protein